MGVKNTHRVRNTIGVAGIAGTGGLSLAFTKREGYVCPTCGNTVHPKWMNTRSRASSPSNPAQSERERALASLESDIRYAEIGLKNVTSGKVKGDRAVALDGARRRLDDLKKKRGELLAHAADEETSRQEAQTHTPSLLESLERLAALHRNGALTQDEFEAAKNQILLATTQDRPKHSE